VRSVSSNELAVAAAVIVIEPNASVPELARSTTRCSVSPGTIASAPSVRRLLAPGDGIESNTVSDEIAVWLTLLAVVNVA
jgi:hypothetical protein